MRTVGIKVLKNKLSEYVRAAASGETVLVTDRDRVVAELRPPSADRVAEINELRRQHGAPPLDPVIARGIREGWVTPATRFGPLPEPTNLPRIPLEQLLADLSKDREDR